ncbi:hypothetical protein LRP52_39945 [Photobacterium sp. ZSDE20]|uniref:Uncharacterized protein n=1 Tax=Photobacterium pectinilyticum TaxID=2906793 RepID=A0ABT1NA28_9GAMM|nr:hypothetical protein [Photobacterium sp. ZSDE20]MCQ1060719.1 hypothetical protein [Photobacterium sp. ZSDE20]MDD1828354.1 hypothetical protein [Photobacterium sp. ZSDE20]
MFKLSKTLPFFAVILLAACGGESDNGNGEVETPVNSTTEALDQLVSSGKYPDLDTSDTFAGLVVNNPQ